MKASIHTQEHSRLPLKELVVLLSKDYHSTLKESIDTILVQLGTAHAIEEKNEELTKTKTLAGLLREFFFQHAAKEGRFLFPLSEKQVTEKDADELRLFITSLKSEHRQLTKKILRIRMLTNNYNCGPAASPSQKLAYARLNEFEQDVNRLIYIEEEFLFPRLLLVYQKNKTQ